MNKNSFEPIELEHINGFLGEPACINDTDIVEDFLTDDIFQENIYSSEKNEHLGFIAGFPTIVDVRNTGVDISLVLPSRFSNVEMSLWRYQVIENLVGISEGRNGVFYYINMETQLVYEMKVSACHIKLRIYHFR